MKTHQTAENQCLHQILEIELLITKIYTNLLRKTTLHNATIIL
jgi:hypothetical protein